MTSRCVMIKGLRQVSDKINFIRCVSYTDGVELIYFDLSKANKGLVYKSD